MRAAFMMVPHDLFRTTALSLHDKMALLAIIDVGRSDMPNKWTPLSIEKMVRHTGMSKASCYRSIKRLGELGVLEMDSQYGRTPLFQIQWDALDALVDAAEIVSQGDDSVSQGDDSVSQGDEVVSQGDNLRPSTRGNAGEYKSISRSRKKRERGEGKPRRSRTSSNDEEMWG